MSRLNGPILTVNCCARGGIGAALHDKPASTLAALGDAARAPEVADRGMSAGTAGAGVVAGRGPSEAEGSEELVGLEGVAELGVHDLFFEAAVKAVSQQFEGVLAQPLTEVLAIEQLLLRLRGQIGDANDVAGNQHVDQVLEHAHQIGVQTGKALQMLFATHEGLDTRMIRRHELAAGDRFAVQTDDQTVGTEQGVRHGNHQLCEPRLSTTATPRLSRHLHLTDPPLTGCEAMHALTCFALGPGPSP